MLQARIKILAAESRGMTRQKRALQEWKPIGWGLKSHKEEEE